MAHAYSVSCPPQMTYRRCGNSGLHVSSLSLALSFDTGDERHPGLQKPLIRKAFGAGINHFDLPASWAARNIGQYSHARSTLSTLRQYREEVVISAHVGFGSRHGQASGFGSRKQILSSLSAILRGLSLECVDVLYSDRYDPHTPLEETMAALASAVKQGKALYLGLSGYAPAMARRAVDILYDLGTPPVVYQGSFSVLNPWPEDALLDILDSYGVSFIADNPLASGLLDSDDFFESKQRTRPLNWQVDPVEPAIDSLKGFAKTRGQSLSQLALSWVLRDQQVSSAIITPNSLLQLEEFWGVIEQAPLAENELQEIARSIYSGH